MSKIRIKLGAIEVEYEGSEEFLKAELPDLLSAVSKLYKDSGFENVGGDRKAASEGADSGSGGKKKSIGTTGTIAAKLRVSSGSDLFIAAAAKLMIGDGLPAAPRQKLIDEMKNAKGYFKKTYVNNLSKYIRSLIREAKIVENSKDNFSLSAATKKELEGRLAG